MAHDYFLPNTHRTFRRTETSLHTFHGACRGMKNYSAAEFSNVKKTSTVNDLQCMGRTKCHIISI